MYGRSSGVIVGGFKKDYAKPAAWDYFRRLGAIKTNGSSEIIPFKQDGNNFELDVPLYVINDQAPGITPVTRDIGTPSGIALRARLLLRLEDSTPDGSALLATALDQPATAPSAPMHDLYIHTNSTGHHQVHVERMIKTDTASSIRTENSVSNAGITVDGWLKGWVDTRKRDA